MEDTSTYYQSKLVKLVQSLFIDSRTARNKFIALEDLFEASYHASQGKGLPVISTSSWKKMWSELNSKPLIVSKRTGETWESSFRVTVRSKRNKTLEKYLLFLLEEYSRIRNKL